MKVEFFSCKSNFKLDYELHHYDVICKVISKYSPWISIKTLKPIFLNYRTFWPDVRSDLAAPLVVRLLLSDAVLPPGQVRCGVPPDHVLKHSLARQAGGETLFVNKLVQSKPDQDRSTAGQH